MKYFNTVKLKKGKLLISHRYNRLPLLPSDPGGFGRSQSYKTYPSAKVIKKSVLQFYFVYL